MMDDSIKKINKLLLITSDLIRTPTRTQFQTILAITLRKDHFKLAAISQLSSSISNGDTILDLSRSLLEDMINIEYMISKGKDRSAEQFAAYLSIEEYQDMVFLNSNGITYEQEHTKEVEDNFEKNRAKFTRDDKSLFRNWTGRDVDGMLNSLMKRNLLTRDEKDLLAESYVQGNRQNHLSPYSIKFYLNQKALDTRHEASFEIGSSTSLICFSRTASILATELSLTDINKEIEENLKS